MNNDSKCPHCGCPHCAGATVEQPTGIRWPSEENREKIREHADAMLKTVGFAFIEKLIFWTMARDALCTSPAAA